MQTFGGDLSFRENPEKNRGETAGVHNIRPARMNSGDTNSKFASQDEFVGMSRSIESPWHLASKIRSPK